MSLRLPPRLDDKIITELVDESFKRLPSNCTRPIIQLIDDEAQAWMDYSRQPENPLGPEIYDHIDWHEMSQGERYSAPVDSDEVIVID